MNKIIAIDVDNTVVHTVEQWFRFVEIFLNENNIPFNKKEGEFFYTKAYGIEEGSLLHKRCNDRLIELNYQRYDDCDLVKGAKESINFLHELGFELVFITARTDSFYKDAKFVTTNQLKNKGIPFDDVIIGCDEKGMKCREIGADILIDDGLKYCKGALAFGIQPIYFYDKDKRLHLSPENDDEDIITCESWQEILNKVLEFYKIDVHFDKINEK